MQHPTVAYILIGVGVCVVLLSGFADSLGLGRHPGFGLFQTIGVVIGALVILAGLYLWFKQRMSR
jgi:hypothetical protein